MSEGSESTATQTQMKKRAAPSVSSYVTKLAQTFYYSKYRNFCGRLAYIELIQVLSSALEPKENDLSTMW